MSPILSTYKITSEIFLIINVWWDHEDTFISIQSATGKTDLQEKPDFKWVATKVHDNELSFSNYIVISKTMKVKNVYSSGLWYLNIHTQGMYMYICTCILCHTWHT